MKHSTRSIFVIVTLIGVFVASADFVSPVNEVVDVTILSHTGYLDSSGYYHVVGEIQNTGDEAITHVRIKATFIHSLGYIEEIIAENSTWTELKVLLVGRKSPFEIVLLNKTQSALVDRYILSPCRPCIWTASPLPVSLEILSSSSYIDDTGRMHITGEIENIGGKKATGIKVIALYYNEAGKVVDTEFNYSDPRDIEPGQKALFSITLNSERTPHVDRYELTAESTQYAAMVSEPTDNGVEFPTWVLIPLFIVLAVIIAVYKRRRKRKILKRSTRRY